MEIDYDVDTISSKDAIRLVYENAVHSHIIIVSIAIFSYFRVRLCVYACLSQSWFIRIYQCVTSSVFVVRVII